MSEDMDTGPLYCERMRLLLSLAIDGEATPAQSDELAAHLPDCADCRAARAVDLAVRERLAERAAEEPDPGFGRRVTTAAADLHAARRGVRRMLLGSAAAAGLLGAVSGGWLALGAPRGEPGSDLAMLERTKMAVIAPHAGQRR
jgi:anti-sigma factor RsiW